VKIVDFTLSKTIRNLAKKDLKYESDDEQAFKAMYRTGNLFLCTKKSSFVEFGN